MENPYQSPEALEQATVTEAKPAQSMPGIRRVRFWEIIIALTVIERVIAFGIGVLEYSILWIILLALVSTFVSLYPLYSRLQNIGSNPMWCLLVFVPIASLFLMLRCLAYPEGYAQSKTLDKSARVIIRVLLFLLLLALVSVVAAVRFNIANFFVPS